MSRAVAVATSQPPSPDAFLTGAEVAAWLKITPRQVQRMGIPCVRLGPRTPRYLGRDVLAWLETQRRASSMESRRRPRRDAAVISSGDGTSLADVGTA